jgi:hypothetical protein
VSGVRRRILLIAVLLQLASVVARVAQPGSRAPGADSAPATPSPLSASAIVDSMMSESDFIEQNIEKFATSAYRARISDLRFLQRRGYSEVLMELCARDGLGGLTEYVRMILQIEYSIDHTPIFFRTSANELKPLPMSWAFPEDPWKRR